MRGFALLIVLIPLYAPASFGSQGSEPCGQAIREKKAAERRSFLDQLQIYPERFAMRLSSSSLLASTLLKPEAQGLAQYFHSMLPKKAEGLIEVSTPFRLLVLAHRSPSRITLKIPVVAALDPETGESVEYGEKNRSDWNIWSSLTGALLIFVAEQLQREQSLQEIDIEFQEVKPPRVKAHLRRLGLSPEEAPTRLNRDPEAENFRIRFERSSHAEG